MPHIIEGHVTTNIVTRPGNASILSAATRHGIPELKSLSHVVVPEAETERRSQIELQALISHGYQAILKHTQPEDKCSIGLTRKGDVRRHWHIQKMSTSREFNAAKILSRNNACG